MAEREGFEPPVPFRVQQFSRLPVSTTHTPLRLLQFYYSPSDFLVRTLERFFLFKQIQAVRLRVQRFSRPTVSSTHTALRGGLMSVYNSAALVRDWARALIALGAIFIGENKVNSYFRL